MVQHLLVFKAHCVCIPSSKVGQHGRLGIPELKLTLCKPPSAQTETSSCDSSNCVTFLFYAIKTKLGKRTREKFKIGSNDVNPSFPGKQKVVPTAKKRYFINGGFQSTFKYYQIKF